MAFWTQASKSQTSAGPRQAAGPAQPLSFLLHSPSDFSTLVRLKIRLASNNLTHSTENDDDDPMLATRTAAALAQLHRLIMSIEAKSEDTAKLSVTEVLELPENLQLLCQKAAAAKIFKSLMPHQAALGFTLGDVKSCISLTPLGLWETHEALQTALIKALTGSSCGTCSTLLAGQADAAAGTTETAQASPAGQHQQRQWMCLSRNRLISCSLLSCKPAELHTAAVVEFEARGQPPNKVLLLVKAAGSVKFKLFSPMQMLAAEPKAIRAPLHPSDTDDMLLASRAKLAAAARQLDGRQIKLLPDERPVFVKSLQSCPSDPEKLRAIADYWLGTYGLLLPDNFPFLVGIAGHPDAEEAVMQVPSCCVLTNLGLAALPGSQPGGRAFSHALQQLLQDVQSSSLQLLGNRGFMIEEDAAAAGVTDSQVQVSSQPAGSAEGGTTTAVQPKQFSLGASWTSAKEISKLQAAAKAQAAAAGRCNVTEAGTAGKGARKPTAAAAVLTSAAAQLIGLHELTGVTAPISSADTGRQQHRSMLAERPTINNFRKLKQFLEEQREEQTAADTFSRPPGSCASSSGSKAAAALPARGVAACSNDTTIGRALNRPTVDTGGPPLIPKFGGRKPAGSTAAVASKSIANKPTGAAGAIAKLKAALATKAQSAPDTAAAAVAGGSSSIDVAVDAAVATAPAATAVGQKRPAAAAGGKPTAAAKKAKAVGSKSAAADGNKAKAAAAAKIAAGVPGPAAAEATVAAASHSGRCGAAEASTATPTGATAAAAPKRTKTKASELDINAVTSKVLAAYAAGSGGNLKGLSVPEMQCYLRAHGQRGGPTKKADVEARLLALLAISKCESTGAN